jgi:hypothetical protein
MAFNDDLIAQFRKNRGVITEGRSPAATCCC